MPSARAASASRSGGMASVATGYLHRDDMAREAGEIGEKRAGVLVRHHADDDHERPRDPLFEVAQRTPPRRARPRHCGRRRARFRTRRPLIHQRARRQTLHPRRPFGVDDAGLERRWLDPECVKRAQRRNRKAGIVELMTAEQSWRRQIHQAAIVLIDQASALDADVPLLPGRMQRRMQAPGALFDHGDRLRRLLGANHRARRA